MNPNVQDIHNRIPIAVSLNADLNRQDLSPALKSDKKRLLYIAMLAVLIAFLISIIARLLVYLINLITNIAFFHRLSAAAASPAANHYGLWGILVPAAGGVLVGLMALYGSKAIRGHGIPEAMEQILTNKSRIRPSITYLKPISSAISIGTGGPFGAEGPIIATGGALGSTIGQLLKISHNERKVLLASGATAGMSAIFGSPVAAIFLAIELLLFEFSLRSIVPVALACVTGAAGHHLLFEPGPVFAMPFVSVPGNGAIALYSIFGLICGLLAALVTKSVYLIEDAFEKLPVHWMWWPMIGGLAVGIVGYFSPRTLGVGYDNIAALLSGKTVLPVVAALCVLKFTSWAIALGSGTSGGTLAPLLTIGGATGVLLGMLTLHFFPGCGVSLALAALVGMSAMFAGASRALLTSIVFAIETTSQANAILPLLAACVASYLVSYLLMKNTIMTEKIARRGVATPHTYEPDILNHIKVKQVLQPEAVIIGDTVTIAEARAWLLSEKNEPQNFYVVAGSDGVFKGIVSAADLLSLYHHEDSNTGSLVKRKPFAVGTENSLKEAVEIMGREDLDVLPVVNDANNKVTGVISYKEILSVYHTRLEEQEENITISLKRRSLKILLHGRKTLAVLKNGF